MTREAAARAAILLYPDSIRGAPGAELVGTLLDAGEHSQVAFMTQLGSVILGGLRARSRDARTQPMAQLFYDVLRWAAVISVGLEVTGSVASYAHRSGGSIPITYNTVLPTLIVLMFLRRLDRAAGVIGLAYLIIDAVNHPLAPRERPR